MIQRDPQIAQEHARLLQLSAAVEAMQFGVTITDLQGRIVYVNAADAAMHGYAVSELLGRDAHLFAPPDRRRRLSGEQLRDMSKWVRETTNQRKDGSTFPVRLLSNVIRGTDGEPLGVVTTCEDITERRVLEEELRHAQKMEALGQLTGGIAHDFNNLLTVILTNLDLLIASVPAGDGEIQMDITEIRNAARRGSSLVRRLLAFSRKERISLESLDLTAFVAEQHDILRRVLPESIDVRVVAGEGLHPASADPSAVQQVLLNLVTNARDAMPDGGTLEIQTCRIVLDDRFLAEFGWGDPGEYMSLVVSDTGIGMSKEVRARLFEPFFTTKPPGKGTGLGMAMVYGLVKQQGGFVHITSEEGHGTTVRLLFHPAAAVSIEHLPDMEPAPVLPGRETILVVEDDAAIRRAAERVLVHHGYRVLVAGDGVEALDLLRIHASDVGLVVSDVVMPNLGGRELFARIRDEGMTLPVILTTGYALGDLDQQSLDTGVPLLRKPWTVEELLASVREALDGAAAPPRR